MSVGTTRSCQFVEVVEAQAEDHIGRRLEAAASDTPVSRRRQSGPRGSYSQCLGSRHRGPDPMGKDPVGTKSSGEVVPVLALTEVA